MVNRPEIQGNSIENFELYTELEYLFDSGANENNYYYQWTDITYSPNDLVICRHQWSTH